MQKEAKKKKKTSEKKQHSENEEPVKSLTKGVGEGDI